MSNERFIFAKAATSIMVWLRMAEQDLVGRLITTTTNEVGECHALALDNDHGLCFTLDNPKNTEPRWQPVSMIKRYNPKATQ